MSPLWYAEIAVLNVQRMVTTAVATILLCIQTIMYTATVAGTTEEETEE
jgi:hypothetical protein